MASESVAEARNVTKVYGSGARRVTALQDVSLSLEIAEMVAVMGPSGCGKTTLLNCLSGLDDVTSGEVIVGGTRLASLSDGAKTVHRARHMGFIFQAFNLLPIFSAVENVELPLLLTGMKGKPARQQALQVLKDVGLSGKSSRRPSQLSAGEQQRVALARAVAPKPSVLWADEPTGNLDSENATAVLKLIDDLRKEQGLSVLLVTHDDEIAGRADRTIHMKDGRILD